MNALQERGIDYPDSATFREPVEQTVPDPDLIKKIVIVSEASLEHTSGVTNSVKKVSEYLVGRGIEVTIICPNPAPESYAGAEVIPTDSLNIMGFDVGYQSAKKFKKRLKSLDPDVVHVAAPMRVPNGIMFLGGNAITAANKLDIPITAVYQTDAVRFAERLHLGLTTHVIEQQLKKMHNRADLTLYPSSSSLHDLIQWGIHQETLRHWARGVDTSLFSAERRGSDAVQKVRETWAPNGEVIIGVVSRLEPEKSLHKLQVINRIPGTKLVVIGKGTERTHLQRVLGNNTIFTGRLSGEELANAYAALDVFAFPSTADTFAQVVQEAHASGVPVVAANRGGPRDLIDHGTTGYLYEPTSKRKPDEELRHYVEILVKDQELRRAMGQAGYEHVACRTWQAMGAKILGYYEEATEIRSAKVELEKKLAQDLAQAY